MRTKRGLIPPRWSGHVVARAARSGTTPPAVVPRCSSNHVARRGGEPGLSQVPK